MSAIEIIRKRHCYRGRYLPTPVPREDLVAIMQAGLDAPSGCNQQTTSLIGVDDPQILSQLYNIIHPGAEGAAPAAICVLTQRVVSYRGHCYATQDYAAAIENMLLAAVELGYQSCWYEGQVADTDRIGYQMAQILQVPDEYELVCFLPIGVAEAKVVPPKKKQFAERAWLNGFQAK